MSEFEFIKHLKARLTHSAHTILGVGDDAAVVDCPAGEQLVVTTDTLNVGVHFLQETAPEDLGWKALAVNLSDLAAMGAQPRWCTLAISVDHANAHWFERFLEGLLALAHQHGVDLIGGDMTQGRLSVTITAIGTVPDGQAIRRDGAQSGDDLWVTGCLGEAAGALAYSRVGQLNLHARAADPSDEKLRQRLIRPIPRIAAGIGLRNLASAAIDVSDGLLADLRHICQASQVGAHVVFAALPHVAEDPRLGGWQAMADLALTGGDDYELCFTAPVTARAAIDAAMVTSATPAARIGTIESGSALRVTLQTGEYALPSVLGYEHFR